MINDKNVIASTPEDIGTPQSRWDRKKFDDFISDKGYHCYIERAIKCPCAPRGIGSALSNCKNCGGTSWMFIDRQKSIIACTSISNKTKYYQWTEANMGTVNISSRAQDKMGFMDKVILTELESWFSQVIYPKAVIGDVPNEDKVFSFLVYEPISVFDLFLFIDSDTPLKYLTSTDYTVDHNKILIKKSSIPNYNSSIEYQLSIRYTHNPCYIILDVNRDLIKQKNGTAIDADKTNEPLNYIGRRLHYVLNNPNYDEGLFDNTDYQRAATKYDR